jgi:hypothetical protein
MKFLYPKMMPAITMGVLTASFIAIQLLSMPFAFAQPNVEISPSCGPESGFDIKISAKGFSPNTNINWQIVSSDGEIPLYGYFETDSDGKISDTTFADQLMKGNYKLYFGEDADDDGEVDSSNGDNYVGLDIPCRDKD